MQCIINIYITENRKTAKFIKTKMKGYNLCVCNYLTIIIKNKNAENERSIIFIAIANPITEFVV